MGTCVLSSELRMVSILLGSSFRMFELSESFAETSICM